MNMKAVVLMSALAAALLAAAPVARADCCYTTGYNDKCEIAFPQLQAMGCGDGSCPDSAVGYCGVGSCNVFGCDCDGGCRGGSKYSFPGLRRLLQDAPPAPADSGAMTNPPRSATTKDAIQSVFNVYAGTASGISLERMQATLGRSSTPAEIGQTFQSLDKNGNGVIDPEEFDSELVF